MLIKAGAGAQRRQVRGLRYRAHFVPKEEPLMAAAAVMVRFAFIAVATPNIAMPMVAAVDQEPPVTQDIRPQARKVET